MATTAERILDSAQALAQTRGFNGFSYADISAELGLSKPSVHHHFPTKNRLAEALVERYRQRFDTARTEVTRSASGPRSLLEGYAALYAEVFTDGGRMCLCGVFAADASSLPAAAQQATREFFADQQRWVASVLQDTGMPGPAARRAAHAYLAALEGALLLARAEHAGAGNRPPAAGAVLEVAATMLDALHLPHP